MKTDSLPRSVELEIFRNLLVSAAERMGQALTRAAYSANIKERRDFSCALFDPAGRLIAQAAHMPVHLGSMHDSVAAVLSAFAPAEGDEILHNDPFAGGTHLPDINLVAPVYLDGRLIGIVANRAHHADVGGKSPGSMALSRSIDEEGLRLAPTKWYAAGKEIEAVTHRVLSAVRTPQERLGDLEAQRAANHVGAAALREAYRRFGHDRFEALSVHLMDYSERVMRAAIERIPEGRYSFRDYLDDDGAGTGPLPIQAAITINGSSVVVDFEGSSPQVAGCVNCPATVTRSATYYVFACLAGPRLVHNAGMYRPIAFKFPEDCMLNARYPAAVVAGNVETSQRVVDVVIGALAGQSAGDADAAAVAARLRSHQELLCAAASGTMNSLALGGMNPRTGRSFTYYETIPGGMGASAAGPGESGVQTHMTNTLNTPTEALEAEYPLRVVQYRIVPGAGGAGRFRGGDGICREILALAPMSGTIMADRRTHAPYGLFGGRSGQPGSTVIIRADGREETLPGKAAFDLAAGDRIRITTPGGGGWGEAG